MEIRVSFVVEFVINHVLGDQAATVFNIVNSPCKLSRTGKVYSKSVVMVQLGRVWPVV